MDYILTYILTYSLPLFLLIAIALFGLAMTFFGLPGLWVIAGGALIFRLITGFSKISFLTIIILFAIAGIGEIADLLVGIKIAKRFKASRRGIVGGIIGAIAGAIVGVPLPLIGSLLGMFMGAFIGTYLFEYSKSKDNQQALQAAKGFFLGRIGAIFVKVFLAVVMIIIIFGKVF